MTSETTPVAADTKRIRSALLRYRVMAWVTGIWLIALCAEMVLKYIVQVDWPLDWIPQVHGFVYFVYVLVTFDLAVKVRWPLSTTIGTLIAGTIPLLGIIVEHVRTGEIKSRFNLQEQPTSAAAAPATDPDATQHPSAPG